MLNPIFPSFNSARFLQEILQLLTNNLEEIKYLFWLKIQNIFIKKGVLQTDGIDDAVDDY